MNTYEITHKGQKHKVQGEKLFTSMMNWCVERKIDLNEIESCVLIEHKNMFSKFKIKNSFISDLFIEANRKSGFNFSAITGYTLKIDFVSKNNGNADKEINDLFERLLEIQRDK